LRGGTRLLPLAGRLSSCLTLNSEPQVWQMHSIDVVNRAAILMSGDWQRGQ
jgi:hypothetical protein